MSGSYIEYDDLTQALAAYQAAPHPVEGWQRRFGRVALAAHRCGKPGGVPTLPWAERRVATYQNPVSFAVSPAFGLVSQRREMLAKIRS